MMSRPIDVDQVADALGAIAGQVLRDPRFASETALAIVRRVDALRVDIAVALAPRAARPSAPVHQSVDQWV